mmetsp:Transcript_3616/g.10419  ORF Transcript_3616/g.10419 Transcript_3616/m.10419 type:complete len:213 (-) Transcript_3616:47-685(-)
MALTLEDGNASTRACLRSSHFSHPRTNSSFAFATGPGSRRACTRRSACARRPYSARDRRSPSPARLSRSPCEASGSRRRTAPTGWRRRCNATQASAPCGRRAPGTAASGVWPRGARPRSPLRAAPSAYAFATSFPTNRPASSATSLHKLRSSVPRRPSPYLAGRSSASRHVWFLQASASRRVTSRTGCRPRQRKRAPHHGPGPGTGGCSRCP